MRRRRRDNREVIYGTWKIIQLPNLFCINRMHEGPLPALSRRPKRWILTTRASPKTVPRGIADTELGAIGPSPLPMSPEPSASTAPSTVQLSGRSMSAASGRASRTITVARANPEPNPVERAVILEQRLSERPEDIREAARALSKAIADQIDLLNASKTNDPDALARHDDLIAFLRQIAERLDGLADALDGAIDAASSERAASAASIARSLGAFVREGLEEHRAALRACAVQVPVIGGCVWLLHALGVDSTVAFTAIAAIVGAKTVSKDGAKK